MLSLWRGAGSRARMEFEFELHSLSEKGVRQLGSSCGRWLTSEFTQCGGQEGALATQQRTSERVGFPTLDAEGLAGVRRAS